MKEPKVALNLKGLEIIKATKLSETEIDKSVAVKSFDENNMNSNISLNMKKFS